MRWLLFLSRLAFISGICIVVWLVLAMMRTENNEVLSSTVITIGYVMGAVFLPLVNICYLVVVLGRRRLRSSVPLWLILCNLLFLFVLVFYIFYFNDPYYNQ